MSQAQLPDRLQRLAEKLRPLPLDEVDAFITSKSEELVEHLMEIAIAVLDRDAKTQEAHPDLERKEVAAFRLLGRGEILPSLARRYWSNPDVLIEAARYSPAQQRSLASGKHVPFTQFDGHDFVTDMRSAGDLSPSQVKQVFGPDRIRDAAEQQQYCRDRERRRESQRRKKELESLPCIIDGCIVAKRLLPIAEALELIASYPSLDEADRKRLHAIAAKQHRARFDEVMAAPAGEPR